MPAARGYVRVSTDDQAQNGVSIEAQQQILNAYAVVKGFDDFEIYTDGGYSGKNMNCRLPRPAYLRRGGLAAGSALPLPARRAGAG